MKQIGCALFAIGLMGFSCAASPGAEPIGFDGAKWIWFSSGFEEELGQLPAAVNYFRAASEIPENAKVKSAEIIITCDNLFVLYLNGQSVGESQADNSAWSKPKRWDVSSRLVPGRNVVAVQAVNTLPGPAGLIVKLIVTLADDRQVVLATNATWMASGTQRPNWQDPEFDDSHWNDARVVGQFGDAPWRSVAVTAPAQPAGTPVGQVQRVADEALRQAAAQQRFVTPVAEVPGDDYPWPEAVVYLGDDCSLCRPLVSTASSVDSLNVTIFNPRNSRAFPEHDLPAPMKVGRKLYVLRPARPGVSPQLLLDAGRGGIGSPSVSFDGQSILLSMAYDGDPFFHIYRLPASGGSPQQLTDGPFHDIDPAELPDGRIVFTSTRIGTFEEYHNPPSRSLFTMNADGDDIQPLTHTIIFDNEPEVLADGRILFIRSDNFFDRGKVETLLHAVHTDGTEGYTEFGLDIGPDYGGRLRSFYCGSPAPMPDGRLAFVTNRGITVGRLGSMDKDLQNFRVEAGGVAALPDGRLLCTTPRRVEVEVTVGNQQRTVQDLQYDKIEILDPRCQPATLTTLLDSPGAPLHSPVSLAARPKPRQMAEKVNLVAAEDGQATGILYCQDARFTKNTTAGWSNVRAIRVLAGKGLTMRSSHSYIVHAGSEVTELGTVPLASDGSFAVEVPADTPIAFQAVDAEGRSELNEMSWIYVRPGEQRGCVGCHQRRQDTPPHSTTLPMAFQTAPLKLLRQGDPQRFRGNNAAVTGQMELQLDRYREVAGINRYSKTKPRDEAPGATGVSPVTKARGATGVSPVLKGQHEQDSRGTGQFRFDTALLVQLRGSDNGLKISAAQRLSILRDAIAEPSLASCLRDSNREVRVAVAISLATCGTRDSVQPLLDRLIDREPLVAQAAAMALENLTGYAPPFNAFAERGPRRVQADAWRQWFEDTTWEQIEQDLIERLDSPDRETVRRAAVALGHIGGQSARSALRQYVIRHRDVNPLPAWRQAGNVGDRARFNSLSDVNPRTLQAATRALGYLRDTESVTMLAETIRNNTDAETANLFLTEAAAQALGRIGTPEAEAALIESFAGLQDYPRYTSWYGDHAALMACHASPVHYYITEALDAIQSTRARSIVPHLIRSVPIDPDRALLPGNDDCEMVIGRVIRRNGAETAVVETCLAVLGDPQAERDPEIEAAISAIHRCWAGHPDAENRAAQILSLVCRDGRYEPRIRAAFERYRARPTEIPRVFDTGIPVVLAMPAKHWVCFYLARALGNLADPQSTETLIASLRDEPAEAATGYPDPLGPGVLFLHNDLTPCWRAAAAWALGRIGDRRAVPVLLDVVGNMDNATDTRYSAAEALGRIGDPASGERIERLAADYPEISTRRALQQACRDCGQSSHFARMAGD
jgi:HEAT repeat protein